MAVTNTSNKRPHIVQSLWFLFALLLLVIAFIGIYLTLPERVTQIWLRAYVNEHATEWYDEISELRILSEQDFVNLELESSKVRRLEEFAHVGGMYGFDIFNKDLSAHWSSGHDAKIEIKDTIRYQLLNTQTDKQLSAWIELYERENSDFNEGDYSAVLKKFPSAKVTEYAKAVIPINAQGETHGFIQLHYNISEIYNWYLRNIRLGVLLAAGLCIFVLSFSAVFNILLSYRNHLHARRLREKESFEVSITQKRTREIETLSELSQWLQSAKNLGEYFDILSKFLGYFFKERKGAIYVIDERSGKYNLRSILEFQSSRFSTTYLIFTMLGDETGANF